MRGFMPKEFCNTCRSIFTNASWEAMQCHLNHAQTSTGYALHGQAALSYVQQKPELKASSLRAFRGSVRVPAWESPQVSNFPKSVSLNKAR
jgi:hypothetical protein